MGCGSIKLTDDGMTGTLFIETLGHWVIVHAYSWRVMDARWKYGRRLTRMCDVAVDEEPGLHGPFTPSMGGGQM